jgi:hypothetical protein
VDIQRWIIVEKELDASAWEEGLKEKRDENPTKPRGGVATKLGAIPAPTVTANTAQAASMAAAVDAAVVDPWNTGVSVD